MTRLLTKFIAALLVTALLLLPANATLARKHSPVGGLVPGLGTTTVRIYLIAMGNGTVRPGTIGCGDRVVSVTRHIPATHTPLRAAILQLLALQGWSTYGHIRLYSTLSRANLSINWLAIAKGTATIAFTGRLNINGVCDSPRVRAQLRRTALQFPTVHRVIITINGVPLSNVLSSR